MARGQMTNENKLVLIYFLYQMDIPVAWSQLLDFAVAEYMDYLDFQTSLSQMLENGLLIKSEENGNDFYALSDEGYSCVNFFSKRLPETVLNKIIAYVRKNRKKLKHEYSVFSNYFSNDDSYIVKCGVIEDDTPLIELNLTVFTKEQAKTVRKNWKNNINDIYKTIIDCMLSENTEVVEKSTQELNEKVKNVVEKERELAEGK